MEALQPGDPERVGGYVLQARLGAGGMGQVFLGRSPSGLPVAVKVVHASLVGGGGFRARFRREVTAARSVSGAFTAPVIDADPDAPLPWLAIAFLPGMSLQDAVGTYGPFPAPTVYALGAGLAEALTSIHRAGVVHRDLKPSNVMLGPDGPRVIDFGIAHAAEADVVTQAGTTIGSPGYLSPEQARGAETGPASDVFSFGAVLCYAATGDGPFGEAAVEVLLYRVVHEAPRLDGVTDPELRGLVAGCLDKSPERRPVPTDLLNWLAYRAPQTDVLQGTAWLPGPVAAEITRRTSQAPPPAVTPPGVTPPGVTAYEPTRPRLNRRRFLILGGAGAGVALTAGGGIAVAVAAAGEGSGGQAATSSGARSARSASSVPSVPPSPTRGGRVRWKRPTGKVSASSNPTVADGTVYFGGGLGGNLLALDARTGKPRWQRQIAPAGLAGVGAPEVAGGVVYMGSFNGGVYALDVPTGRVRWRYSAGRQVDPAAVAAGGTVYVASQLGELPELDEGYLTALNAATGTVKWRHRTKKGVASEIAVAGGSVYLADDSLYALDAATGREKWRYANPDAASPAVAGGVVYCGNSEGEELHAVDAATGKRRWHITTGTAVSARPLVTGGTVYAGDQAGNMWALDAATGAVRWQRQTRGRFESGAVVLAGGLVCFGGESHVRKDNSNSLRAEGDVYAVQAATGDVVWRHHTGKAISTSPATDGTSGGTVYITCEDGFIYALDIKGGAETVPPTAG